jgi:hypothetical protein
VVVVVDVDVIEPVILAALVNGNDRVAVIDTVDEGANRRTTRPDKAKHCTIAEARR